MKRLLIAGTLALALITPAVVIAQSQPTPDEAMEQIAAVVIAAGYALPTTTAPPTTTTAPTTTTTAPTTTTTAPTTTTQPPTTTTTLGNPPQHEGEAYDFMVNIQGEGNAWVAPYHLDLGNGIGWGYGNRDGYRCMYGILVEGDALTSQSPVGRFTVTRIDGAAAYVLINDRDMPDRGPLLRHFGNGLLDPPDGVRQGECPPPDANVNYEPFTGPGQLPVVDYVGPGGQILERRDYRTVANNDPRLKFRLFSETDQKVTVVAYWENLPIVVVYYEAPWGDVRMEAFIP